MTKIKEINVQTGVEIERDMTAEELAQREIDIQRYQDQENEKNARLAAKQAVLDKLGLTTEEAVSLLS
jgi:hypothetical protein